MIDEVVKPTRAPELRVLVVWVPIVPEDDDAAAARAAARCAEPRVSHYWDPDRALGDALGRVLALPPHEPGRANGVAWDVYLLFEQGARWGAAPSSWMQQLDDVPVSRAPRLSTAALRREVAALLAKRAL